MAFNLQFQTKNEVIMSRFYILILSLLLLVSCQDNTNRSDAYGNFEATATLISAQANGHLLFLNIVEGEKVPIGALVGIVDTTLLHLQRQQIEASLGTLPKKLRNTLADIQVLQKQKANLSRERDRIARLVEKKAATPQKLDDLNGKIKVVNQQVKALRSRTATGNQAILAEKAPLLAQIEIVNEKIRQSYIYNPVRGTILTQLTEPHEFVRMGAPLYRIGKLDTMTLRFYTDAVQLQNLALGQQIEILVDKGVDDYHQINGVISWISEQAEFTPKTIQTKEDRVNLVYAVKAKVPNPNGLLKIGMPAEVNFGTKETGNEE